VATQRRVGFTYRQATDGVDHIDLTNQRSGINDLTLQGYSASRAVLASKCGSSIAGSSANFCVMDQWDESAWILPDAEAPGSVLTGEEIVDICHIVYRKIIIGLARNVVNKPFRIMIYYRGTRGKLC
jgi:hypothetical protein